MAFQKDFQIEELAKKLRPIFGKKIDELYFRYLNADKLDEKNEIFQVFASLYQKHLNKLLDNSVLLEPPKEDLVDGEYPLAHVSYANKTLFWFSLREQDWPRHVCVTGMSGSGKTNFAMNVLKNFVEKEKPFLVFDWKKSFRPLINKDSSILCLPIGNGNVGTVFRTNINRPPKGVLPKEWINVLCDLLAESFNVSFGVHKILVETLDETFENWGVYQNSELYPNWEHIKRMLEIKSRDAKGREAGWYESALRVATILTFGEFGKTINYEGKRGIEIEEILNKKVILELNSLSNIEKTFFCEYVLTYIFKSKKAEENYFSGKFKQAILVDEAHNIFLKKQTKFVNESITDVIYREMREYGIGLICLDQHASKLSDTVIGNSACHVVFQQQLPQDVEEVSSLMQLRNKKEIFTSLPVGSAIVKLSERHTSPFLVEVPLNEIKKEFLEDRKIKRKMEAINQEIEIKNEDPEFFKKIVCPEIEIPNLSNEPSSPKKEEIIIQAVNKTQKIIYDFIREQYASGKKLYEIEKILEEGLRFRKYTKKDLLITLDQFLEEKLSTSKFEKKKVEIQIETTLTSEESNFLKFLSENQEHDLSTVEFYKSVGLSPRKGNVIKNKLLEKNKIVIYEEKNPNGWKKLIRLNHTQQ